ncbi:MAG: hypothetical protein NVSMB2_17040 [Chloroflexota bacterium]
MSGRLYRCYAKVNLTLEILGRRADGYHDIASLSHTINLADDLRISDSDTLLSRVEGLAIEPSANLVTRAAMLMQTAMGRAPGAELTLVKRIPSAAGLGGGSSDAAAALIGLNRLWGAGLTLTELAEFARQLGSDVPFFLRGGAAVMSGRGDTLEPLPPLRTQWLVLVVPEDELTDKTRRLYAALEPIDFSSGEATRQARAVLQHGSLEDAHLTNAFSRAARGMFPSLASAWEDVEQRCGRRFHLSGAGPTLFALALNRDDALRQAALLARHGFAAQAIRTVKHARVSVATVDDSPIEYA